MCGKFGKVTQFSSFKLEVPDILSTVFIQIATGMILNPSSDLLKVIYAFTSANFVTSVFFFSPLSANSPAHCSWKRVYVHREVAC